MTDDTAVRLPNEADRPLPGMGAGVFPFDDRLGDVVNWYQSDDPRYVPEGRQRPTARARATALRKVAGVIPGWEDLTLDEWVDRKEDAVRVFRAQAKENNTMTDGSISTYLSRVDSAIPEFRAARAQFFARQRMVDSVRNGDVDTLVRNAVVHARDIDIIASTNLNRLIISPRMTMFDYKLPLADGTTAELKLPRNLSPRDAERVARFVSALAMDDTAVDEGRSSPYRH